jgi:putative DNA primase/helicase
MPMRLYLQRLVGYTLTGTTQEHVLVFHYGSTGSNGKSTFLAALRTLMGDYGCSAPRSLLFEPKNGAEPHPTELARLYGKRLATCAEVPENAELAEAKVKDLTGGDVLSVRRMNENFWDLVPSHTLHAAGNHKPIIRGTDGGIWRRIKLVPWLNQVAEADKDHDLKTKLEREQPGILAWAVRGCLEWQRTGLDEPTDVTDAGLEYRSESDVLGAFFDGQCVFEADARFSCKYLRKAYETWCEDLGHRSVGARILGRRLREKGVTDITVRVDGRPAQGWHGVRLKTTIEAGELEDPHASVN